MNGGEAPFTEARRIVMAAATKEPKTPDPSAGASAAIEEEPAPSGPVKRKLSGLEQGDKVSYVVNRPYSAGEHPDIVEATVAKVHDKKVGVVDIEVGGDEEKKTSVGFSERREPGTWHFG
jgi:hypothetical protein